MNTTMSQLPARPAESAALTALKSNIIWPKELMEVLGYKSRSPFWQAVRDLRIPCVKVNARKVYFLRPQVEAWLDNQTRAYK